MFSVNTGLYTEGIMKRIEDNMQNLKTITLPPRRYCSSSSCFAEALRATPRAPKNYLNCCTYDLRFYGNWGKIYAHGKRA